MSMQILQDYPTRIFIASSTFIQSNTLLMILLIFYDIINKIISLAADQSGLEIKLHKIA